MLKPMDNHIIAHLSLKDRHCPKCRGFLTIEREIDCDDVVCLQCGLRVNGYEHLRQSSNEAVK